MNPGIFIDDFERTEHSDALHGVLGRALVIATRFDAMCKAAALQIEFVGAADLGDEKGRSLLIDRIAEKHRTLNSSLKALGLPKDVSILLHDANRARNAVAHDLAKGLTGCLDTKIDVSLIKEVSELMFDIAYGDVVICQLIGELNGEPSPRAEIVSTYVERVIRWVADE
jgi:hypothetical protein